MPNSIINELQGAAISDIIRRVRLSFDDVAKLEQRSKKTIQNLVSAGRYPIPVRIDSCGRKYFLAAEVMKHLCGFIDVEHPKSKRGRPRKPTNLALCKNSGGEK